ncbi:LOW QUALITY PROTEIN: basic proline-rich protein-like [Phalacrocorax carbo]|uniref:LOW QUALITY PROTEIN: basic proline-rich protein-like n=1 Tax=Phalacrocorax carbo TaxID=9209 RepID=UPI0031196F65
MGALGGALINRVPQNPRPRSPPPSLRSPRADKKTLFLAFSRQAAGAMSHRSGRGAGGDPRPGGGPHPPGPGPRPGRVKRRRTRRERDTARFGRRVPGEGRRAAGPPPRRPPPPWGGRPLASPLPAPRPVVITESRLCQHRGLFNREVKSVDVERLLSPRRDAAPRGETPAAAPQNRAEEGVPVAPSPRELAGGLCALLGGTRAFRGRDLAGERRRAVLAALLRWHRALPELSPLLAHRSRGADAAPPGTRRRGEGAAPPWPRLTPSRPSQVAGAPGPPSGSGAAAPSGAISGSRDGAGRRRRREGGESEGGVTAPGTPGGFIDPPPPPQTPFSWTSGEEEEEEDDDDPHPGSPTTLFQPRGEGRPSWGDPRRHGGSVAPGGPPPGSPPGCTCGGAPFAPCGFGEDAGEGCSWSRRPPIAPPAFGPVPPRRRRPPRRSLAALFPPRSPAACRGASPDPRTPDAWSPEPSRRLGFASGRPRAERRASRCRRHRHGSHRPGRPPAPPTPGPCRWQPPLARGAPPGSRRRRGWDAPESGCRGEPGWLRALRCLPLSCFPPSGAPGQDASPLPGPAPWGCPCAGLC